MERNENISDLESEVNPSDTSKAYLKFTRFARLNMASMIKIEKWLATT